MLGWLLYKKMEDIIKPEVYEIDRLVNTAARQGIDIRVLSPELAEANLPIPKTILLKFPVEPTIVAKHLKFPVVVKTLSGTQGMGVFLSTSQNSFEA